VAFFVKTQFKTLTPLDYTDHPVTGSRDSFRRVELGCAS
jgi:hypothetical protein